MMQEFLGPVHKAKFGAAKATMPGTGEISVNCPGPALALALPARYFSTLGLPSLAAS